MDAGIYIDAHPGIGAEAAAAEDAGFSHVWVYDSPLVFSDVYIACALALQATSTAVVGPGVTTALARPAYATAQAIGTLSKIAPGRVALGMGIGNSARWSLGMKPAKLDRMYEETKVITDLIAGRTTTHREGEREARIRLIHPRGRWVDTDSHVPLWISAFGPKGQRRAGAVADGILIRWEGAAAVEEARARIAEGAERAGRDPAEIRIGVVFAVYPVESDDDLDTQEARDAIGPLVVSRLRFLTANHTDPAEVPERFRAGFEAYARHRDSLPEDERHLDNYRGYLVFVPEDLQEFVTPEAMRTVCRVDSPAGVIKELQEMQRAGVDQVTLQMTGDVESYCRRMGSLVLPHVTGKETASA